MENVNSLSRRSFLGLAGALPLVWAAASRLHAAAGRKIPIALQLYSVRGDCKENFDKTLEQVAAMGFAGVEFAGYYNYTGKAADLKKRLDSLQLKAEGTHVQLSALEGEELKKTIEFHQAIGCPFLIVPMHGDFTDPEKSKVLADKFNAIAEALKPLKMATGYHNHVNEFKNKDAGKTFWDLFAERTSKDVILQQDCGWTMTAGYDPVEYVKKYPGRTRSTHFKATVKEGDTGKKAILGQDSVDWAGVYAACQSVGGTDWLVVEQETYPDSRPPMDCTRDSLAGLKKITG